MAHPGARYHARAIIPQLYARMGLRHIPDNGPAAIVAAPFRWFTGRARRSREARSRRPIGISSGAWRRGMPPPLPCSTTATPPGRSAPLFACLMTTSRQPSEQSSNSSWLSGAAHPRSTRRTPRCGRGCWPSCSDLPALPASPPYPARVAWMAQCRPSERREARPHLSEVSASHRSRVRGRQ